MKTKRIVIVQCRLSSTRLPGKALKDLAGRPVLAWCLSAMHKVKADRYFVATDHDSYEKLLPVCKENNFECFAGDLNDVLQRFVDLLNTVDCETVIRATADNPFLFYEAAEESAELFEEKNKKGHCDYLTYAGLPHGSGVEIFSAASLKKAITETDSPYDHEHVVPAFYNHKDRYTCEFVPAPRRFDYPQLRTTIDTYSDFIRALSIINYLGNIPSPYTTEQILEACHSKAVEAPVVLLPSVVKGHGTGHLRRCLAAARDCPKFFVYIPENKSLDEADSVIAEYKAAGLRANQIITQLPDETYSPILVSDSFELTEKEAAEYKNARALISIDEGSQYSDFSDYLLDIIPSYKIERLANKFDSSFIEKPGNVKNSKSENFSQILICLGGEDPAGFTAPVEKALKTIFPQASVTSVLPSKPIHNLREELHNFDLVITHYGLTAFEAVYAGCAVILLPTSKLHKKLAQKYNFAYVADSKITVKALEKALHSENLYPKLPVSSEKNSLAGFINAVAGGKRLLCPVCGKSQNQPDKIVSRNDRRTYRRCQECGLVYISYTIEEDKKYEKQYFFEDYKKQYGKTYEEDFDSIKKQGIRRVEVIKSISQDITDQNILDIGCAYGPFLSAAADYGLNPFGTDISDDAIEYVQEQLKFPATVSAFPAINIEQEFGISQFDIVTMWYVIEHFKDLDSVLRKVSSIVKKNGIFAFSTPSGEGVSARSDCQHFYSISPSDHFSVWEPSSAKKVLAKYGFTIEKIVSTGHHPERFPSIKKCGAKPGSLKWNLIDKYSKAQNLGDTMEIYCRKNWS